ncbi:MAG: single-stranded-DNA-specific exonuclease RecJ [Oscillospiraceae bacterium]|nr:single-stranded-DNA-specific exonuclease RecJ [Oscillospiraceae bacterium]
MKYAQWRLSSCDGAAVAAMRTAGYDPLTAELLCVRRLDTPEKAAAFLSCSPSRLQDPFLMKDMDVAVSRIHSALDDGETIAVYGDYDVDGITSTALLTHFLRSKGAVVHPYIPDRLEEGYGLNTDALAALAAEGVTLVITVDCGITAVEEAAFAKGLGIDLIITDHHECKAAPEGVAASVNPRRPDCPYPFKALAGVGVALKLALALTEPERRGEVLAEYADLAAIGTVADVMEMTGENRVIVSMGLELLQTDPRRPGLAALFHTAGLMSKSLTAASISYGLAPRINAAGRMGQADVALGLLLTDSPTEAQQVADALCNLNKLRQETELEIYQDCIARVGDALPPGAHALVLADESWHQGVAGIVASRLAERYGCPVFIICIQNGKGKGSCRACGGFNLFQTLSSCSDLLLRFGGHAAAAGFTIDAEKIGEFEARVNAVAAEVEASGAAASMLEVDSELSDFSLLTLRSVEALSALEPFGTGNPRPVFSLSGVVVDSVVDVGGGKHMKLKLSKGSRRMDAIFFSVTSRDAKVSSGDRLDVAFSPQINEFRGGRSVQLQLLDLRPARTRVEQEQLLYAKLRSGDALTADEANSLIPSRAEFAAVWRYVSRRSGGAPLEDTALHLSRSVARTFGLRETFMRTMVCLEVMHEQGLIKMERRSDHLLIQTGEPEGKVDLEASALMQRLRRCTQGRLENEVTS